MFIFALSCVFVKYVFFIVCVGIYFPHLYVSFQALTLLKLRGKVPPIVKYLWEKVTHHTDFAL